MKMLIARFRMGAGLVAIKPFPLQFEGHVRDELDAALRARGLDRYPTRMASCKRLLRRHYEKLGFRKIPRTEFMALPLVKPLGW